MQLKGGVQLKSKQQKFKNIDLDFKELYAEALKRVSKEQTIKEKKLWNQCYGKQW